MSRLKAHIAAILIGTVILTGTAVASSGTGQQYYQGKVVAVAASSGGMGSPLSVTFLNGPDRGQTVSAGTTGLNSASDITLPTYHKGDIVVVAVSQIPGGGPIYSVLDHYRLPGAAWLLAIVVALAIIFAGRRGLGALVGLAFSLVVLVRFMIPQIIGGQNPYLVVFGGSVVIATLGIYFAHGFSRRTTLALVSTYLTLAIAAGISALAVFTLNLNGLATEDISLLHQQLPALNIQGLLLGGIIVGVLGVLDDITVGQATAVEELHKANHQLKWRQLYASGLKVGREHIASLINTLVLAYVGTSFIFVIYIASVLNLPLWLTLNSELVMEEIVRSLAGSFALILAVPIATLLSAYFLTHTRDQAASSLKRARLAALRRLKAVQ